MHVSEYAALSKSVCEWLIKPVIIHTMEGPIWCVMILCPLSFSDSVFAELVIGGEVCISFTIQIVWRLIWISLWNRRLIRLKKYILFGTFGFRRLYRYGARYWGSLPAISFLHTPQRSDGIVVDLAKDSRLQRQIPLTKSVYREIEGYPKEFCRKQIMSEKKGGGALLWKKGCASVSVFFDCTAGSYEFLPYQPFIVVKCTMMAVTGNGESGFDSGEGAW